jgi:RecB family exonuclease
LSGAGRGTLFHAWLEQIAWIEDAKLDDSQLREIAASMALASLDMTAFIKQFRTLLRRPEIANVLSQANYQRPAELPFSPAVKAELSRGRLEPELFQELRFSVIDAGQSIQGTIDRLVLLRRDGQVVAAEILDFKTDAMLKDDDGALQDLIAAYRDQMKAYARAVGLMYRLPADRISTRLVLLSTGKVVEVGGSTSR